MKQSYNIYHQHMLERQIAPHGPFPAHVMAALERTPRSLFLPDALCDGAYAEAPIVLDKDRIISQPLFYARFMAEMPLAPDRNVMVIAGSTGYGAALFSYHHSTVFMLETDDRYHSVAQTAFKRLNIDNVVLCQGDFRTDLMRQGPFYWIFIEGLVDFVPGSYFDHLEADSPGIFACTPHNGNPALCRFHRKENGDIHGEPLFRATSLPLKDFQRKERFVF